MSILSLDHVKPQTQIRYRKILDRFRFLRRLRNGIVCFSWAARGRGAPFPPAIKQAILVDIAERHRLELLVETGTYFGDTSAELARSFRLVYTIEAAKQLFDAVGLRFSNIPNVKRYYGDSGDVLSAVLPLLDGPALFWLDAHVQGYAISGELNPILREVRAITSDARYNHVLAIDDMRLFGKNSDYPSFGELREAVTGKCQMVTIADIAIVCLNDRG